MAHIRHGRIFSSLTDIYESDEEEETIPEQSFSQDVFGRDETDTLIDEHIDSGLGSPLDSLRVLTHDTLSVQYALNAPRNEDAHGTCESQTSQVPTSLQSRPSAEATADGCCSQDDNQDQATLVSFSDSDDDVEDIFSDQAQHHHRHVTAAASTIYELLPRLLQDQDDPDQLLDPATIHGPQDSTGSFTNYAEWHCDPPTAFSDAGHDETMPSQDTITVGVEWEILVDPASSPYGDMHEMPPGVQLAELRPHNNRKLDSAATYHVVEVLRAMGLRAATEPEVALALRSPDWGRRHLPEADHSLPPRVRFADYYVVKKDTSLHEEIEVEGREEWLPVEICSPVLREDEIPALQDVFRRLQTVLRLRANFSCGLHVHVGNATRGLPLPWMRNMAALCWAVTPIMDAFHPASRGPTVEWTLGLRYMAELAHNKATLALASPGESPAAPAPRSLLCVSRAAHKRRQDEHQHQHRRIRLRRAGWTLSLFPPAQAYGQGPDPVYLPLAPRRRPRPITHTIHALAQADLLNSFIIDDRMAWCGVKRLLGAESTMEVLQMLESQTPQASRLAYNFNNLRHQSEVLGTCPMTVEIRQHAGTANVDEIGAWMQVCCALLRFAQPRETDEHIREVARRAINDDKYDAYDLMRDIGAGEQAKFYLQGRGRTKYAMGERLRRAAVLTKETLAEIKRRFRNFREDMAEAHTAGHERYDGVGVRSSGD